MIAMVSVWTQAGQTMWIHTGHVHWAYNTESVGTMPYSSANLLTVLDKGFTLADVDSVTVDSQTLADDNVLVKYNGGSADVFVAGNIANHITAQVTGARVAVMQDADVASEYTYTLQGNSTSGCFYHAGKYKMTLVLNGVNLTNPASAAVCGMDIVEVKSLSDGTIDVDALQNLLRVSGDAIAAMMMTNPNTLGLFERQIPVIEKMVHDCGALMYYDGANLNPMLGAARPGDMGFDVMHINLHKTFSTPHGGGGPGAGPVGVRKGLEQFFPEVSPYHGNFAVAMRAYAYILSLGREHVKQVGPLATLNANYIKESLKDVYELPIEGLCKHEFVFDGLKDKSTGVTTMDVAKRLLDYGYHAPTIYFPLLFHESLMIEPTENESKETIDGFISVMRQIAQEAKENPELVKTAPHNTPIGRVDDVLAAKHPVVTWRQIQTEE